MRVRKDLNLRTNDTNRNVCDDGNLRNRTHVTDHRLHWDLSIQTHAWDNSSVCNDTELRIQRRSETKKNYVNNAKKSNLFSWSSIRVRGDYKILVHDACDWWTERAWRCYTNQPHSCDFSIVCENNKVTVTPIDARHMTQLFLCTRVARETTKSCSNSIAPSLQRWSEMTINWNWELIRHEDDSKVGART